MTMVAVVSAVNEKVHIHDVLKKAKHYVDNIIVVDYYSKDATASIAHIFDANVTHRGKNMNKFRPLRASLIFRCLRCCQINGNVLG